MRVVLDSDAPDLKGPTWLPCGTLGNSHISKRLRDIHSNLEGFHKYHVLSSDRIVSQVPITSCSHRRYG
jgi:hypothetical protein